MQPPGLYFSIGFQIFGINLLLTCALHTVRTTFIIVFVHCAICSSAGGAHFGASLLHWVDSGEDGFVDVHIRWDSQGGWDWEVLLKDTQDVSADGRSPLGGREVNFEFDVKVSEIVMTIRWHSLTLKDLDFA